MFFSVDGAMRGIQKFRPFERNPEMPVYLSRFGAIKPPKVPKQQDAIHLKTLGNSDQNNSCNRSLFGKRQRT